jgi:hypothetical protein
MAPYDQQYGEKSANTLKGLPREIDLKDFDKFTELGLTKEALRRENQGLKVYPVDDSSVFSMTGTYF